MQDFQIGDKVLLRPGARKDLFLTREWSEVLVITKITHLDTFPIEAENQRGIKYSFRPSELTLVERTTT